MTLARAFIERKRLTTAYNLLRKKLDFRMDLIRDVEDTKKPFDYDESWEKLQEYGQALSEFNAEIDTANANSEARYVLSLLTDLKIQLSIAVKNKDMIADFQPERREWDERLFDKEANSRGAYVTHKYELITKIDWEKEVSILKKKIREQENKLAEINASVNVIVADFVQNVLDNID